MKTIATAFGALRRATVGGALVLALPSLSVLAQAAPAALAFAGEQKRTPPSRAPAGTVSLDGRRGYRVRLGPGQFLYHLAAPPGPGTYRLQLAGAPPPLCKLELATPLPSGRYRLFIESRVADADHTFVFSIPVAGGAYSFVITASGHARYDFVLEGGPGWETRQTFIAPRRAYTFESTIPAPPASK
jgi:hypothetical protein